MGITKKKNKFYIIWYLLAIEVLKVSRFYDSIPYNRLPEGVSSISISNLTLFRDFVSMWSILDANS